MGIEYNIAKVEQGCSVPFQVRVRYFDREQGCKIQYVNWAPDRDASMTPILEIGVSHPLIDENPKFVHTDSHTYKALNAECSAVNDFLRDRVPRIYDSRKYIPLTALAALVLNLPVGTDPFMYRNVCSKPQVPALASEEMERRGWIETREAGLSADQDDADDDPAPKTQWRFTDRGWEVRKALHLLQIEELAALKAYGQRTN